MKPLVKESEKSRVLMTKDYSIFEFPDVGISKKHLEFVKESLLDKNLMPDYPIIVDDDYNIIDGKYKFLACYELRLPVYYKISEVTTVQDAIRIKEIFKKSSLKQIIDAYKTIEKYSNLLYVESYFNGFFKMQEIIYMIDGMVRNSRDLHPNTLNVLRYKFASGKLTEYDVNVLIKRLTTVKYLTEEFQWDKKDAIALMFLKNYSIDFVSESQRIRMALRISKVSGHSPFMEYSFIENMDAAEQEKRLSEETYWFNLDQSEQQGIYSESHKNVPPER